MKVSIREKRVLCREELQSLFGRGVLEDLLRAGWLKPCCEKESATRTRKLYSMRDVEHCEARLQGGEYPRFKSESAPSRKGVAA